MLLRDGMTILFQGDSITDCNRDRAQAEGPASLGEGYPMMAAAAITARYPALRIRYVNRGVSGHRVCDLCQRWQADCLDIKPDLFSLLIGINDVWRHMGSGDYTDLETFTAQYRQLLQPLADMGARILLLEPFVLHTGVAHIGWRDDLDPKIQAIRALADEFRALYIPLDGLFAAAAAVSTPAVWAEDGIHPTAAGHALIARHWLAAVTG